MLFDFYVSYAIECFNIIVIDIKEMLSTPGCTPTVNRVTVHFEMLSIST